MLLYEYLVPLGLLWAAAVLYDPGAVRPTVRAALAVVAAAYVLLTRTLPSLDVAVDYDDVEAIDLDVPDRTADVEYADFEPTRWAFREREGYETTVRFPTGAQAERARTLLSECPVADRLAVTEADEKTVDTDHRVVVDDGVVRRENCESQVSPTDERCPSCDYGIRADPPAEPPSEETPTDDAGPVANEYRVEVRAGATFCENCGLQVSPADDQCRHCETALRVERTTATDREG